MGANAQTSVPAFTAGQVLTAQQQTEINTGVPVFADLTARNAAFGGSGEKTLAEGQLAYLEDSNVVQYYDGSSWATVGPQTLSSGLNYITGAAFTSVTSVSLPNNTFTSTYRNYRVILHTTAAASDTAATMRLRASGTDDTANTYRWAALGLQDNGTATNVVSNGNATSWQIIQTNTDPQPSTISFDLIAPEVATTTLFHGTSSMSNNASGHILRIFAGRFVNTTQFDALSFLFAANTSGVYRVYGYADS